MIQNMTNLNTSEIATSTAFNSSQYSYQNMTLIFAAITFLITLFALVYKYGQHVGEMKGIKEVIDAKLESIDQKYNTTEELQNIELNVKDKAEKNYVDKSLSDVGIFIQELKISAGETKKDIATIKNDINRLEKLEIQHRDELISLIVKGRIEPETAAREKTYYDEDFGGHA